MGQREEIQFALCTAEYRFDILIMQQLAASGLNVGKLHPSSESTGAVQMRIKSPSNPHDRSSQSKSLVFSENLKVIESVSRHRRNHSQHNIPHLESTGPLEKQIIKEGYLLKAKIADEGKKLRKNWSTSWIVLTGRKIEFYKESKQPAVPNLELPHVPHTCLLCCRAPAAIAAARPVVLQPPPAQGVSCHHCRCHRKACPVAIAAMRRVLLLLPSPQGGAAPHAPHTLTMPQGMSCCHCCRQHEVHHAAMKHVLPPP
ncbi:rho GTPase-activating protein 15 [Crotalus adamanteus]|uniref:Rho GTPase-activating protein 15 n=1 Tax=Crotalus adamanteus TaxID=8729 RepID=A0AAW1C8F0_CROAD